jgi:hypothetical protein
LCVNFETEKDIRCDKARPQLALSKTFETARKSKSKGDKKTILVKRKKLTKDETKRKGKAEIKSERKMKFREREKRR